MALKQLGELEAAHQQFKAFVEWAQAHREDGVEADFFAVSLPDLIALNGDALKQHQQHCLFVEALGWLGLGDIAAFNQRLEALLILNPAHDKAHLLRQALSTGVL